MSADDVRARFEAWLLDRGIEATRRANGYYQSDETCFWWKLWQDAESAARADLSGEVRELKMVVEGLSQYSHNAQDVRELVEAATNLAESADKHDDLGVLRDEIAATRAALARFTQEKP